ncbi:hypothetical protein B0H19DRAFT_1079482 [Mycena capillaripes]|nr:hypothetical protein B0H19DRAFT_1079482 [Mycena capillaripes]
MPYLSHTNGSISTGTAISSSGAGGNGDSAAGRRLNEERTRLGGDATARSSEGQPCLNDPQRASGSSLPDDERRTESSVQERIMADAEELQAPHRLTSRDLVHLDEDTAGVSSRPAIGLRTAEIPGHPGYNLFKHNHLKG